MRAARLLTSLIVSYKIKGSQTMVGRSSKRKIEGRKAQPRKLLRLFRVKMTEGKVVLR